MERFRTLSKKLIIISLILSIISIYMPAISLVSLAANNITSLNTPSNLRWKDKSTATASWDAVENANYYLVNVIVYNGEEMIGIQETGTSTNEIDLQQEIYTILQSRNLESYQITFNVCAKYISDNEDIISEISNNCELLSVNRKNGIKLTTPTNVSIDNNRIARWTDVPEAGLYQVEYSMNCNTYTDLFIWKHDGKIKDGMFEIDLTNSINNAYKFFKYNNETVEVSFKVLSEASAGDNTHIDSDYSKSSNNIFYNPNGSTVINEIDLSPNKPVIAVGRTIYLGKTITPEDAIYDKINWSTSDNSIVSINNMGQITGIKKGNATITAQINNASQSADVSVYEITSNISNSEENSQVLDKATDIITAITKDKDTSNTDITNVNDAINEIETGAENGNDFNIDVKYNTKSANEYKNIEDKVKTKYGKDKQIAGGYDVKMELSHTDKQKQEHHIGNITKFDNNVTFEVNLLANMPEIKLGQKRKYSMAKLHNNELELLKVNVNDNKISTSSNEFSDFILLYQDEDLKGDVSIDSKVNITDVALVNAHVKKAKLLTGEELARADINGDGKVNITDVALINSHVKKIKMLDD